MNIDELLKEKEIVEMVEEIEWCCWFMGVWDGN